MRRSRELSSLVETVRPTLDETGRRRVPYSSPAPAARSRRRRRRRYRAARRWGRAGVGVSRFFVIRIRASAPYPDRAPTRRRESPPHVAVLFLIGAGNGARARDY